MKKINTYTTLSLVLGALLFTACGSSDSSDELVNNSGSLNTTIEGRVADGYLVGAKVCLDTNANGLCDIGEPSATTKEHGAYTIRGITQGDKSKYSLLAEISASTVDEDTNLAVGKEYRLSAVPNETFISPISSAIKNYVFENNTTLLFANNVMATRLGLLRPSEVSQDYIKTVNVNMHKFAQVIAALKVAVAQKIQNIDAQAFTQNEGNIIQAYINFIIEKRLEELSTNIKNGDSVDSILGTQEALISVSDYSQKIVEIKDRFKKPVIIVKRDEAPQPSYTRAIQRTGFWNGVWTSDDRYIANAATWDGLVSQRYTSWYKYEVRALNFVDGRAKSTDTVIINSHSFKAYSGAYPDLISCSQKIVSLATDTKLQVVDMTCKAIDKFGDEINSQTVRMSGSNINLSPLFTYVSYDGYYLVEQKGGISQSVQ